MQMWGRKQQVIVIQPKIIQIAEYQRRNANARLKSLNSDSNKTKDFISKAARVIVVAKCHEHIQCYWKRKFWGDKWLILSWRKWF